MAKAPDNALPERDRARYLLEGESVIFAVNEHWIRILEPLVTVVVALVVAVYVDASMPSSARVVANVCWWLWFAAIARALFLAYEWRNTWFIATNKRMLRVYGLISRQVAMMPLGKVTDLRYQRSVPGRLLGYGTFVMESAGQNQALEQVHFVPHPDKNYRALVAEIFGIADPGAVQEADDDALDDEYAVDHEYDEHDEHPDDDYGYADPDTQDDLPIVRETHGYDDLRAWNDHADADDHRDRWRRRH